MHIYLTTVKSHQPLREVGREGQGEVKIRPGSGKNGGLTSGWEEGWRLLRCVGAYLLDHHKMSPTVREGRRQVQIGPGSDKKRFQNGRVALVALC